MDSELLGLVIFNNTFEQYILSLVLFLTGILAIKVFEGIVLRRMKARASATETKLDDFLVEVIDKAAIPVLFFGTFYLALQPLTLHAKFERAMSLFGIALGTYVIVRFLSALLSHYFEHYWLVREEDRPRKQSMRKLLPIAKGLIWAAGLTFLLDNMGFKISTVVAGLGIGGVAFALAAQAILGDLFSYFAIVLDRPFLVGDYITVGEFAGWVEHIGIKTTRLRSQTGEQLIVPNKDLTGSRLRNFRRMERRRVQLTVGVTYQTRPELISAIPAIIEGIIKDIEHVEFERAHLKTCGAYSLDYETVFNIKGNDYMQYMDIQQAFNLALLSEFRARRIELAYPTQTVVNVIKDTQ